MKQHYFNYTLATIAILVGVFLMMFGPKGNLYNYLKQKRLDYHYRQQFEKHKIVCYQCKGSGEYPTDVNKLMMEASLALFINHHLMVDKCEKCVKLKSGDGYAYCDVVNDRYNILLREYGAAGRKIEMAACDKCMGMGTFTCKKSDGTYKTQKEYDEENEKN